MTKNEFLRELEILLKAEPGFLNENTPIEGLKGWDSLMNMEFRMFVEEELGRDVDGLKVERAQSVGELIALVNDLLED